MWIHQQAVNHGVRKVCFGAFWALMFITFLTIASFRQRILPGVSVDTVPLGGKTLEEATKEMAKHETSIETQEIVLMFDKTSFATPAASLEIRNDTAQGIAKAYEVGRTGNLFHKTSQLFQSFFKRTPITSPFTANEQAFRGWAHVIADTVNVQGKDPSISLRISGVASSLTITPGVLGRSLDQDELFRRFQKHIAVLPEFSQAAIEVPTKITAPLSPEDITQVRLRAQHVVGKSVTIHLDDVTETWNDQTLIALFALPTGYNQGKFDQRIRDLEKMVIRPPQEPQITVEDGKVTAFTPPLHGRSFEHDLATQYMHSAVERIETSDDKKQTVDIPVVTVDPKTKLADLNNLGIKERIGFTETFFHHSIPNRVHNVELTAKRLNLVLIPPGGTFSYNGVIGEVSARTGFLPAYIIQQGRTVFGDGGGLCQASTTMFRVALNAGLPIVERRGHSYRVSYYEENALPGIDATVFAPSTDIKFKNDTPGNILVTTWIDPKNYHMIVELWGTSDGRKAEILNHRVWDKTGPKPTIYQDDPALPLGTVRQVDFAAGGAKAAFEYKVTRGNEVLQDREFKTVYQAWAAVYLRGTGQ